MTDPLLSIEDLSVRFATGGFWQRASASVQAVSDVRFGLAAGEIVGVVGESGCGKTTLARTILGLLRPDAGHIRFDGQDVAGFSGKQLTAYHRHVQMVFQDPFESLNPRKTVLQTLSLPLAMHRIVPPETFAAEAARLLDLVGLQPGAAFLQRYPHQFSGGQRQRICIARALAVRPRVIVADEAVSALDISVRAQILALLRKLRDELGVAVLFITHDLGVVRSLCDRVVVMYLGRIVEQGPTEALFTCPRHPYTAELMRACPIPDPDLARARDVAPLAGDPPSPLAPPPGCTFHTRCPHAAPLCATDVPAALAFGDQSAACHFAADAASWPAPIPVPEEA
jgi:oligopeptide/dipeptide ABC transporter ATP-binding protein